MFYPNNDLTSMIAHWHWQSQWHTCEVGTRIDLAGASPPRPPRIQLRTQKGEYGKWKVSATGLLVTRP